MWFFLLWAQLPPQGHVMQEGHLPTPFSATALQRACVTGHETVMFMHPLGQEAFFSKVRFVEPDAEMAHFEAQNYGLDGQPMGPIQTASASWKQLQSHASFPKDATQLSEETITCLLGELTCWKYAVTTPNGSETFWFSKQHPGPPVKILSQADGTSQTSMQILSIAVIP